MTDSTVPAVMTSRVGAAKNRPAKPQQPRIRGEERDVLLLMVVRVEPVSVPRDARDTSPRPIGPADSNLRVRYQKRQRLDAVANAKTA